jgi:hypothetical protein
MTIKINNNYNKISRNQRQAKEVQRLMKMYRSRSAIWEMVAGITITLLPRYRQDNIDLQRSLLVLTMIPQLMFGVSHAPFLKW